MAHDIIEAIDYWRKNDQDTIATKDIGSELWYYTCKGPPGSPRCLIWNNVRCLWEVMKPTLWDEATQVRRLQEGPEYFMTKEVALECLQTVPTKTDEAQQNFVPPVEIEAFGYRQVGGEFTTLAERQISGDWKGEWLYGCRYNRVFHIWNKVQKAWEPYKLGVRREHCLTEAEAKECLRSVPTLKEGERK